MSDEHCIASSVSERWNRRDWLAAGAAAALSPFLTGASYNHTYFNRRIPDEAHQKMGALGPQGITSFSFTPGDGWVITTANGPLFARNIPGECYDKVREFVKGGARVNCIAFPPAGGNRWVIATNKGVFARNIPEECYQRMLTYIGAGHEIVHVAFPPAGGNRWVVVSSGPFFARNIDDECYQMMRNLSQLGRRIKRVEFSWVNNGWAIITEDSFFARRIDDECFQKMRSFWSGGWALHTIAFRPRSNGWSLYSRGKRGAQPANQARQTEDRLKPSPRLGFTDVWTRMQQLNAPGLTAVVVVNNRVAWSGGYGFLKKGDWAGAAHPESRFQAASLSKPVAALGVYRLIEETRGLTLNSDIRPRLDWTLPARSCLTVTGTPTISLVLRHRGGIIGRGATNPMNACSGFVDDEGGGFGGYPEGQTVPTLLEIMNGDNTNSPRIELTTDPGMVSAYSGAGYVLLQRMIEQVSGDSFADYMRTKILAPLGMYNSRYDMAIPQSWISQKQIAAGHKNNGDVISGERNRYPESAAAGLYTSVLDLAKMIIYLNRRYSGLNVAGPLSQSSVNSLLTVAGFPSGGGATSANFSYSHGGSNYGFKCQIKGYPNIGAGYVVLSNTDNSDLQSEFAAAIRDVYGWA